MPGLYLSATTAGNYILKFGGFTLGTWVEKFTSSMKRHNEVQVRHNFWSTAVVLDGQFPAIVYEHEFTLYADAVSRETFAEEFHDFSDYFSGLENLLEIQDADGASICSFGMCYLTGQPELKTPEALLMFAAGFVALKFIGRTKPTW